MDKTEFLDLLRRALVGKIDNGSIEEYITFYSDYFVAEMQKGQTEAQVLEHLGDPRLIAMNIVNVANKAIEEEQAEQEEYWEEAAEQEAKEEKRIKRGIGLLQFLLRFWKPILITVLIVILLLILLVVYLIARYLWPVILGGVVLLIGVGLVRFMIKKD